jgi:Protein of unknown function (DUF1573)
MSKALQFLILVLLFLGVAESCVAALEWTTTSARLKAEIGQEKAVTLFFFRNAGDHAIRIVSAASSCGCLVAKPDKDHYAPGESGAILAEMNLAGRVGLQSRPITITTDDAPGKPTILTVIVDIPETLTIKPRLLFWRLGSNAEEKSAEIVIADPAKITLGNVQCDSPLFEVHLEHQGNGATYLLRVKPKDTSSPITGVIRFPTVVAGQPQVTIVYALVK